MVLLFRYNWGCDAYILPLILNLHFAICISSWVQVVTVSYYTLSPLVSVAQPLLACAPYSVFSKFEC